MSVLPETEMRSYNAPLSGAASDHDEGDGSAPPLPSLHPSTPDADDATSLHDELDANAMSFHTVVKDPHSDTAETPFGSPYHLHGDSSDPEASTTKALTGPKRWCATVTGVMQNIVPYGGLLSNIFSLGSVTLGGGIISMPSSFATSGIVMAVIYLVVINIITIYTITLMGYAIEITGYRNYEEMARGLFGRGWDYFVGFIVWLSCFGTAIAYISAVTTLLTPILLKAPHTPAYLRTTSGNRLLTSMIWLGLMLPVVIPKRINSIRYVSAFGVLMVLYFVVTIVVHSATNGMKLGMRDDMVYFTTGNKAIYGLSIFVFSFLSQCITYPVYLEMRPRPSIKRLTIASAIAMTLCMVFYVLAGVFGYFDFAGQTKDSILENFDPVHQPYMMVAYVGMLVKICTAYAMNMVPIRNFIYYCFSWELETVPYWKHTIAVITASTVILVAGLFIPSVNLAFGLVGSFTGGFIGFIFPVLFWMYCGNWSLKTVGIWHYGMCYLVIVAGVIAVVWGTIATIYSSFVDN